MSTTEICPECNQPVFDQVCHGCGLVLEDTPELKGSPFDYASKNQLIIHHQILIPHASLTTIGTKTEQIIYAQKGMQHLAKMHAWSTKSKTFKLYSECNEIFKNLSEHYSLDINTVRPTLELMVQKVYAILPSNSRVKNPTLVASVIFYFYCKSQHMRVSWSEIMGVYALSKSQLWNFCRALNKIPAFQAIQASIFNCKSDYEAVIKYIYNLCAEFKLGDGVYNQAVLIAPRVQGKSQIAAVVAVSKALQELNNSRVKPYQLANWLHVAISTVYGKLSYLVNKSSKSGVRIESPQQIPNILRAPIKSFFVGGLRLLSMHWRRIRSNLQIKRRFFQIKNTENTRFCFDRSSKKVDNPTQCICRYLQDRGKIPNLLLNPYLRDRGKSSIRAG